MSFVVENVSFLENGPYSFTLEPGACLGLCGSSGVGKTQLLRALADLIPFQGCITLNGKSSEEYTPTDWRKNVCLIPAEPSWWYDTVGDHFPSGGAGGGLQEQMSFLGFGEDVWGWEVSRLSTGEKQRLAFLRGIFGQPKILLLDEPTAALDAVNIERLEMLVKKLRTERELAVIWVSHDDSQLARVAGNHILRVTRNGLQEHPGQVETAHVS